MRKESEAAMEEKKELEDMVKPIIDYLKNNHNPHTAIVITDKRMVVVETVFSVPGKCID